MTAAEHLAEAERLLALSERTTGGDWPTFTQDPEERAELRDRAHAHAAIAHAQLLRDVDWTLENRVAVRQP